METKKNILWINYVKAISMLGIFYVHSTGYYEWSIPFLSKFINPIYVNTFFFISGYLLFRKQLSSPVIDETFDQYVNGGETISLEMCFLN